MTDKPTPNFGCVAALALDLVAVLVIVYVLCHWWTLWNIATGVTA